MIIKTLGRAVLIGAIFIQCQNIDWQREACLVGHSAYYAQVMQETFTMIEKDVKWCNLKMIDRGQVINERLFKWHAMGTVNYTDGFLVSLEKISLTGIQAQAIRTTINGTHEHSLYIHGLVNLKDVKIGYDVIANLDDSGTHRFTGEYTHNHVIFHTSITWKPKSNELTITATVNTAGVGQRHMNYRPASNITEMLSRSFEPRGNEVSFNRWAQEFIAPRMLEVAKTIEFPTVRFDNRC